VYQSYLLYRVEISSVALFLEQVVFVRTVLGGELVIKQQLAIS
jgi:hypothetical protein